MTSPTLSAICLPISLCITRDSWDAARCRCTVRGNLRSKTSNGPHKIRQHHFYLRDIPDRILFLNNTKQKTFQSSFGVIKFICTAVMNGASPIGLLPNAFTIWSIPHRTPYTKPRTFRSGKFIALLALIFLFQKFFLFFQSPKQKRA